MLALSQGVQVVIGAIGLGLNLIVGSVVTFGLGLKSTDLVMILLISLIDIVYYSINLLRMTLISAGTLIVTSGLNPEPKWWCPFDTTIYITNYLSSIEIAAILSFMRYLSICKKRDFSSWIWYLACAVSYFSNLTFSLIYTHNGFYRWSGTGLVCVATESPDPNNMTYINYYYFWFSNYIIRSLLALIIIAFSYFNVTSVYYGIISSSADVALKAQITSNIEGTGRTVRRSQYFNTSVVDEYNVQERNIRSQKWMTTLKLCGAILAYSICLMPDISLNIINLLPNGLEGAGVTLTTITVSNLLLNSYGIINASYVLLSHDPSRRYVSLKLECFVNDIKSYFGY